MIVEKVLFFASKVALLKVTAVCRKHEVYNVNCKLDFAISKLITYNLDTMYKSVAIELADDKNNLFTLVSCEGMTHHAEGSAITVTVKFC